MKYKDFFYGDFTLVLYKNFVEPFFAAIDVLFRVMI